uniref:Uncharacterized protein n=1 Tax=viral metagenome TaxID=1070528 RepID=A0A6C0ER68_9ZZZZ
MEKWYEIVGNLKDESEDSYKTQQFTYQVYRELRRSKIKDKGKFKNRMGPEFEQWVAHMSQEFGTDLVQEIINDDEFWLETLLVSQGI